MSTTVNDLRAIPVQVLVNDGTDNLDVSTAFESLELSSSAWDESGWFKPRGPLRLAAHREGFGESFD